MTPVRVFFAYFLHFFTQKVKNHYGLVTPPKVQRLDLLDETLQRFWRPKINAITMRARIKPTLLILISDPRLLTMK